MYGTQDVDTSINRMMRQHSLRQGWVVRDSVVVAKNRLLTRRSPRWCHELAATASARPLVLAGAAGHSAARSRQHRQLTKWAANCRAPHLRRCCWWLPARRSPRARRLRSRRYATCRSRRRRVRHPGQGDRRPRRRRCRRQPLRLTRLLGRHCRHRSLRGAWSCFLRLRSRRRLNSNWARARRPRARSRPARTTNATRGVHVRRCAASRRGSAPRRRRNRPLFVTSQIPVRRFHRAGRGAVGEGAGLCHQFRGHRRAPMPPRPHAPSLLREDPNWAWGVGRARNSHNSLNASDFSSPVPPTLSLAAGVCLAVARSLARAGVQLAARLPGRGMLLRDGSLAATPLEREHVVSLLLPDELPGAPPPAAPGRAAGSAPGWCRGSIPADRHRAVP